MGFPVLAAQEIIAWVDRTSLRWKEFFLSHPAALAIPCNIRETKTSAGLMQHIVAVELRYAERLSALPETEYAAIPCDSAETLQTVHERAMKLLSALDGCNQEWWEQEIRFSTRSGGQLQVSRRVVLFHLLLHSIRHYAQLATLVRRAGFDPGWMMDYLDMRC